MKPPRIEYLPIEEYVDEYVSIEPVRIDPRIETNRVDLRTWPDE